VALMYLVPRNAAETIDDDRNTRNSTLESCLGMAGDCIPRSNAAGMLNKKRGWPIIAISGVQIRALAEQIDAALVAT
jgi:hypothetical protein